MVWFGGEPLLNPEIITIITQKIELGLKNNEVEIFSSLVTNASLFTDSLIQLAKNIWKIKSIQISLDGMYEVHETRKNYINYSPSFDKTIKVISSLLYNNMNVSLRLNYDKDNINSIISLIHFIKDKFGKYSTLKCYAYPLFSNGSNAYGYINTDYDVKKYENIIKDNLLECGFINYTKMLQMRTTSCFATNPYSYVINANGDLYKCSLNMSPKSRIGNVTRNVMASDIIMKWCDPILPAKCNNCIILPICQGGCRANNVLSLNQPYCNIKLNAIDWALTKILTKPHINYGNN